MDNLTDFMVEIRQVIAEYMKQGGEPTHLRLGYMVYKSLCYLMHHEQSKQNPSDDKVQFVKWEDVPKVTQVLGLDIIVDTHSSMILELECTSYLTIKAI